MSNDPRSPRFLELQYFSGGIILVAVDSVATFLPLDNGGCLLGLLGGHDLEVQDSYEDVRAAIWPGYVDAGKEVKDPR